MIALWPEMGTFLRKSYVREIDHAQKIKQFDENIELSYKFRGGGSYGKMRE